MEVHGGLRGPGSPGGEAQQRHVVAAGAHRLEGDRLGQGALVQLGLVSACAVEIDDALQEAAVFLAGLQLPAHAAVAEGEADLGLVDDLAQLAGAQHGHGVDRDPTGLGHRQPGRHHGRVVARADHDPVAGHQRVVLDQDVGQAVGPVGQLLVGAHPAVADQGDVVAEAPFHHAVGQLDSGIQVLRIAEDRVVQQQVRPELRGRQLVPGEAVDMCARSQHVTHSSKRRPPRTGPGAR